MADKCKDKQIIITTHSTYVLNKLGLENLILWGEGKKTMSLMDLKTGTQDYFKKLAGYDTLRLVLAKKAILVEGPSDELIVQKAYYLTKSKLPIEDGIDIISVKGLSFLRFLEIAKLLKKDVCVVTDNDGDHKKKVENKYKEYIGIPNIKICYDTNDSFKTLEPQIVNCNNLINLNKIFKTNIQSNQEMIDYMIDNKTDCALAIFNTNDTFEVPEYVKRSFQ
jgi:putative ATP-dependent endonuclease of the OLD family